MLNDRVKILDCTLRDGGYVNNWEFDTETAIKIIDGLYTSGVRYIEIGIMGKGGNPEKSTKFSSFNEVEVLLRNRKNDCQYAIMITKSESDNFNIPIRSKKTVDIIRIAYFKNELLDALRYATELKEKGYEVFLQAMATFMYSRKELEDMILAINKIQPSAFYIVDSFSNMFPEEVRSIAQMVLDKLDEKIEFGFHAHNNIQMGFANVIEFLKVNSSRAVFVDGSIYGMGRGAGNVPVELIMDYVNRDNIVYDIPVILKVYQDYIRPIFEQYFWGYTHSYYLTASKDMNSVYSWYFFSKGITDIVQLNKALNSVKAENKYTLVRNEADEIIRILKEDKNDGRVKKSTQIDS